MQWLIQCTDLPDTQSLSLLNAVKARSLPYFGIGVIPFEHTITGLETANPKEKSMFYGSCQLIEWVSKWDTFRPGTFYNTSWFDPREWVGRRSDLLNEEMEEIRVCDLRSNWVREPMFIKSVESKVLTGMVIEPEKEDRDNWLIEQSELDGDQHLVMSPAKNIETECRFFVINGEIVSGSTYRWLGARTIRRPVDGLMFTASQKAINEWIPSKNIVIDICRLKNGEHKVIEFNSINSSGFYNCDVGKIVDAIEGSVV